MAAEAGRPQRQPRERWGGPVRKGEESAESRSGIESAGGLTVRGAERGVMRIPNSEAPGGPGLIFVANMGMRGSPLRRGEVTAGGSRWEDKTPGSTPWELQRVGSR